VTIGIAAKCFNDRCLVMASDRRISFGDVVPAAENAALKELNIGVRWRALFTASDTSHAIPVAIQVQDALRPSTGTPRREHPEDVERAFREAYQQVRRQQATDSILSPYDLSLEEFRKLGGQWGDEFQLLSKKLREFDLGVEFLVCGFAENGFSQMFLVKNPGRIKPLFEMDYWAIGSGDYMALATLVQRPLSMLPIGECVYRVCEAKFAAETAAGVGKETTLTVMNHDGHSVNITHMVSEFRKRWEVSRNERVPEEVYAPVHSILKSEGILNR